jgi:hypothetical protein
MSNGTYQQPPNRTTQLRPQIAELGNLIGRTAELQGVSTFVLGEDGL